MPPEFPFSHSSQVYLLKWKFYSIAKSPWLKYVSSFSLNHFRASFCGHQGLAWSGPANCSRLIAPQPPPMSHALRPPLILESLLPILGHSHTLFSLPHMLFSLLHLWLLSRLRPQDVYHLPGKAFLTLPLASPCHPTTLFSILQCPFLFLNSIYHILH